MKSLFFLSVLTMSLGAYANESIQLDSNGLISSIRVLGQGQHVCVSEQSFEKIPFIVRGDSQYEAELLAMRACEEAHGSAFFCEVKECEMDRVNGNSINVIFDVIRNSGSINIQFAGNTKYICSTEAFGKTYFAKAATRVEAKALTKTVCSTDRNGGFFCDVEDKDCRMVEGVEGGIGIDKEGVEVILDGLGELFKRF